MTFKVGDRVRAPRYADHDGWWQDMEIVNIRDFGVSCKAVKLDGLWAFSFDEIELIDDAASYIPEDWS